MTREQQLEAALKQLYADLCSAMLLHPEFSELFLKTDKACRELGVLPPVYEKK